MEKGLFIAIIINIVGISIGVWFLATRIRAKLAEVEARQQAKRERDSA